MAPPTLEDLGSKKGFFLDLPDLEFETKIPLDIEDLEPCLEGFPDYEDLRQIKIKKNRAFIRPRDEFSGGDYQDPVSHLNKLKSTWFNILADTESREALGISYQKQFQTDEGVKIGTAYRSICHIDAAIYVYEDHPILNKVCRPEVSHLYQGIEVTERMKAASLVDIVDELIGESDPETSPLFCVSKPNRSNDYRRDLLFAKPDNANIAIYIKFLERLRKAHYDQNLVEGFDAFIGPTRTGVEGAEAGKDASSWTRLIVGSIIGTFAFVGILGIKEAWSTRKTSKLMDDISDLLKETSKIKVEKSNYAINLEEMDAATRKLVERNEEIMRRPYAERTGKYNIWNAAPNGWGKNGARFPLVVRNPDIEHRETSDERAMGVSGGQYQTIIEQIHSRLPDVLLKYQTKRRWLWTRKPRQVEFHYDEAGRMRTKVEYGKTKKTVFLKWMDPLSDGTMRLTAWSTPIETFDFFRQGLHDSELKPLTNTRFDINWADPKTVDDIVNNLKRGEAPLKKEGYSINIAEDAYSLIAKSGQMKHTEYEMPKGELSLFEGCPYITEARDIGPKPDEYDNNKIKEFVSLTLNEGHVLRAPLAILGDVINQKKKALPAGSKEIVVTYDDVARVIGKNRPAELAILKEYYPEDAKRISGDAPPTSDPRAEAERLLTERFGADWAERLAEAKGVCQAPDLTIRDLLEAHETYSRENQTTMPLEDFLDKIILPEVQKIATAAGSTPPEASESVNTEEAKGPREKFYESFLKTTGLTENSTPQDIVVKLMTAGQHPKVLKDFIALMNDPRFEDYSQQEQIELAHRLVKAHIEGLDARKPEWREIADTFHGEVQTRKAEAAKRQENVDNIEKRVEERRREEKRDKEIKGKP